MRAAWHDAFAAITRSDGVDVRTLPDRSLMHMRLKAIRPDRGGGDATLAGARIDPVPNFGCARLSQAQADPAQPGGSGSILSYELSPATCSTKDAASSSR